MEFFIYIYNTDEGEGDGAMGTRKLGMSMVVCWARKRVNRVLSIPQQSQFPARINFPPKEKRKKKIGNENLLRGTINIRQLWKPGPVSLLYFHLYNPFTTHYHPHSPHPNHHRFIKFSSPIFFFYFSFIFFLFFVDFLFFILFLFYFFALAACLFCHHLSLTPRIFVSIWWW